MTFRSKLILLVAVPLCALVAVTVPGVTSRLAVVRAETRAQHLQAPSAALTQLVQVLDNEHAYSNWYLADGDLRVFLQLKAARVQTDGAVAALRSVAGELGAAHADSAASSLGDLLLRMQRAGKTRQTVDTRVATLDSVNASYQDSVTQALNVVDTMGFSLSDANEVANLRDFATVLRLAAAAGQERAVLTAGFAQGRLPSNLLQETVGAVAAQDAYRASFEAQASSSLRGAFAARIRSGGSVSDPVRVLRADALAGRFGGTTVAAQRWYDASTKQTEVLFAAARGVLSESDHFGTGRKNTAQREMYVYGAGALGALLLALGLALLIGRSATRALRRLTNAADEVTERKLPHLLDALQTGGAPSDIPDVTPAPVESRDEIGVLARAFNKMEQAVVDVAREQTSLLRRGVSELYVNLARRNQNLLERQIRMIDALERDEADPDRLGELFGVDHLATRMRRNAESLLVLASAETARQWEAHVALRDVVRSAASEIADYARVDLGAFEDTLELTGASVVDVTHLLAELLENATSFSPPESRVIVTGEWRESAYTVSITDHGLGIDRGRLEIANRVLAEPPTPGLALSRSLGLIVVSHLAARTGVSVELHSDDGGTTATVTLPASLLATRDGRSPGEVEVPELGETSTREPESTETWAAASERVEPPVSAPVRVEAFEESPGPAEPEAITASSPTPEAWPMRVPEPAPVDARPGESEPVDDFLPHATDAPANAGRRGRRTARAARPPRQARTSRTRERRHRDADAPEEWVGRDNPRAHTDEALSWLVPEAEQPPSPPAPVVSQPVEPQLILPQRVVPDTLGPQSIAPARDGAGDEREAPDGPGRQLSPAGLPQRQRGEARRVAPPLTPQAETTGLPATGSDAPVKRAPEQVMELLARFEAGRQRGALDGHTTHEDRRDASPAEAGVSRVPEDR